MFFKSIVLKASLVTSLIASLTTPPAFSAGRNLCDDLVESGKSSDEQIKKCQAKFGISEHHLEREQKKKWQTDAEEASTAAETKKKENVEFKKFTSTELEEAGFGKPFYAIRVDYSNQYKPKEKRITKGDALCKYLGYEKAIKSIVSSEIHPDSANKNGLVLDTNFLGMISKTPELYTDKDLKFTVRKYQEITCAKIKVKDESTSDLLKEIAEDLVVLNVELNTPKKDSTSRVDDGPRKPAGEGKTPHGYKKPDWATQEAKSVPK